MKIVTIGGGSSYTPELIEGFILRKDRIPITEIWLVDIEEGLEKLTIVGEMAKRMVKSAGLDWEIHLTLDRKEALKNADFVTTQFRVGLLDARCKDERIPYSYGFIGQETNGAGGIFKAFRTIPVILDIINDMKAVCPNAWLINFTNPSGMVTEAAIKHGGWKRTIGLCNVPIGMVDRANKAMELPADSEELYFRFAGLNHFHWHRVWNKKGDEITDVLIEKMYNPKSREENPNMENIRGLPFGYEQVKGSGILPCPYHRYYFITDDMFKHGHEDYLNHKTRAELVSKTEAELFELYKDPNLDYKPEQLSKRGGAHYSDAACETIASIINDDRRVMVVSTENRGSISDLPNDTIVEVSAEITSHGVEPIAWGTFDSNSRGILQLQKAMEEVTIEAAINGDYFKAVQAFTMNPLILGGEKAIEMLNTMLVAHKDYLPQFKDKIEELQKNGVHYEKDY